MMTKGRKGSALLIVLGLLAFMIVSAVAFSAYMRYARLPSSYLRRTTASRELTKAALAKAIDEIDLAVANNPYPGLGIYDARTGGDKANAHRNYFKNHVFVGTNLLYSVSAGPERTTPVTTLEGLAYVPPPLINDFRHFSRRVPTATWRNFGFDAGRYAYCAIDVSDYFDVNRVRANAARSSASSSRISLAYLFENSSHTSAGSNMDTWDSDIDSKTGCQYDSEALSRNFLGGVPLVSVADMNLVIGTKTYGNLFSPWYTYIMSGSVGKGFCGATTPETLAEGVGRMTFVTDGYFPRLDENASEDDKDYDLADPKYQPFKMEALEQPTTSAMSALEKGTEGWQNFFNLLSGVGMMALWDYLDADHVPVSLAVPTTERVPMVCGIKTQFSDCKIKITKTQTEQEAEPASGPAQGVVWHHKRLYEYKIDGDALAQGIMGGSVKPMVVYPFCRDDGSKEVSYELDGQLALFFSSEQMKLRTSANDVLHFGNYKNMTQPKLENGVIRVPFGQGTTVDFKAANIEEEKDAVKDSITCQLSKNASYIGPTLGNSALLSVTYEWDQESQSDGMGKWVWKPSQSYASDMPPADKITQAHTALTPLKADGTVDGDLKSDSSLVGFLKGGSSKTISFNVALWLGVKNSSGKFVDFVPACMKDDDDLNNMKNYQFIGPEANSIAGSPYPLMRLDTGVSFTFSIEGLESFMTDNADGMSVTPTPSTVVVADPRYNHAPENWYEPDGWDMTADNWIDKAVHEYTDDLFMNTSDQGYLQSIYELAFLPRATSNFKESSSRKIPGDAGNPADGRTSLSNGGKGKDQAVQRSYMWSCYDPLDTSDAAAYEDLGYVTTGVKVNPFSSNTNVMMAAFANTPLDWSCAATNTTDNFADDFADMTATEFNRKYAWNEYSSGGKIKYDDLVKVAGNFMYNISNDRRDTQEYTATNLKDFRVTTTDWRSAWRSMGWANDGDDKLGGAELSGDTDTLWGSDRRFLYGYWHDCFESKQQLFLVFVRAEPTMMGGGALNTTPPQLGGKAVALVWRDPTETTVQTQSKSSNGNNATYKGYPHRTRVLFYKALE